MNTNIDFKSLWNQQNTGAIPDIKQLLEKASAFRKKTKRRLILTNSLLALTLAYLFFIFLQTETTLITTKIGILLTVLSIVMYIGVSNTLFPLLSKSKLDETSSVYLNKLIQIKRKQNFLSKTIMNLYFIFLCSGILLTMIEYTLKMSFAWATLSYGLTLLWFAFSWFYIRPKTINKQSKEINLLISQLEDVNKQLTSD